MPDPRTCCLLGVCCPPGSAAQRSALAAWLTAKLAAHFPATDTGREAMVNAWLDELPWGKTAADFPPSRQDDTGGESL